MTTSEGDDVADTPQSGSGSGTRSPDAIQKEIEQTRAELAETIDAIAERISPKRAASRGKAAVKAQVSGVFGSGGDHGSANGSAPKAVLDASPAKSAHTDTQRREQEIRAVASRSAGSAYAGSSEFAVRRTLRTDRVLVVVGVAAAVAGLVILRRSRR